MLYNWVTGYAGRIQGDRHRLGRRGWSTWVSGVGRRAVSYRTYHQPDSGGLRRGEELREDFQGMRGGISTGMDG